MALLVFLAGIAGAIRSWTLTWPLMGVLAVVGVLAATGHGPLTLRMARIRGVLARLTASPGGAATFLLLCILAVWEALWVSAPEIQSDALTFKAWLPALWAQTGRISASTYVNEPLAGSTGSAQLLAVLGHLLGQPATGRFLQYFASLVLTAAIWWYLDRRHVRLAPLWALLVGTTPQIVWQSSTAYDDALSALWCVGLAITVIYTLDDRRGCGGLRGGIVMGLAAGSCLAGKLTLAAFVAAVCAGWWWRSTGRRRQRLLSGIGVFCGAVIVWAPQPAWLWVSTGNPVFPFFNNIFRSPDFPLTATNFNFPYYKPHGITALLLLPFTTSWSPSKLVEATPTAAYGALLLLMFAALLIGWNRERALQVVWIGMLIGFITWWWQVRYLRYLLPYMMLAPIVLTGAPRRRLGYAPQRIISLLEQPVFAVLCAAIAFPSTLASFWDVPSTLPWKVDVGAESEVAYQRQGIAAAPALFAVDRLAGPRSVMIGGSSVRTLLRPGLRFTPSWEFEEQQSLRRPLPHSVAGIYKRRRRAECIGS